jgi:hypothetical protein
MGIRCARLPFARPTDGFEAVPSVSAAVNRDVRVEAGEGGTVVVMSAFCSRCGRNVMPQESGACSWCGTKIVDEDLLPVKEMLAQIEERSAGPGSVSGLVEPAPVSEETPPAAGDGASTVRRRRRGRVEYDRDEIRTSLLRFHDEHGRPPAFRDIKDCAYLPPALAAVEWRDVAIDLGWDDPAAPKRERRQRSGSPPLAEGSLAIRAAGTSATPSPTQESPAAGADALPSLAAPAEHGDLTVDDLWALYEVAGDAQLRSKLRRAIEHALARTAT